MLYQLFRNGQFCCPVRFAVQHPLQWVREYGTISATGRIPPATKQLDTNFWDGSGERFLQRFQGYAVPVPSLCRPVWYPGLGTTLRCPSQSRPVPYLVWEPPVSGPGSLVWEAWPGKHPSLVWEAPVPGLGSTLRAPFEVVPLFSFVVRAAAANVNPRTRLNHVTEIPPVLWS